MPTFPRIRTCAFCAFPLPHSKHTLVVNFQHLLHTPPTVHSCRLSAQRRRQHAPAGEGGGFKV
eukprot:352807-Chlamydomonas_euryale.AAC.1